MKYLLTLLLFTLPVLAANAALVTVTSTYDDISRPGKGVRVKGSGFLVHYKERLFVFTASHVSQGKDPSVELDGKKLDIVGRALAKSNDAEMFEVKGVDPSTAQFERVGGFFRVAGNFSNPRIRYIDSYNFIPLLDWVNDPNLAADNAESKTNPLQIFMDMYGVILHAPVIVQPGTSGAPLLTQVPASWTNAITPYDPREWFSTAAPGETLVRGLVIRRERFFAESSYVPVARLHNMMTRYIKGEAESASKTKWQATGAILFRNSDKVMETVAMSSATAGGVIVDSGNGTSMDGGELGSLGEDSPKDFLERVSAFPTHEGEQAIFWNTMMRHPITSALISYWSWFDMEFYQTLSNFQLLLGPSGEDSLDMVTLAFHRFGKMGEFTSAAGAKVAVEKRGVILQIPLAGNDSLYVELNREGWICEAGFVCPATGKFQPIIEARSALGESYILDLRSLFFVNTAASPGLPFRSVTGNLTDQQRYELQFKAIDEERFKPRLHYRKKAGSNKALTTREAKANVVEWVIN